MRSARAFHLRRLPVWLRLLSLALVPLVGIAIVAVPNVSHHGDVATRTRAAEHEVEALGALVKLQSDLTAEIAPTESAVRAKGFGYDLARTSKLLGFDLEPALVARRHEVDVDLAAYAGFDPVTVAELTPKLVAWRTAFDTDRPIGEVHEPYIAGQLMLTEASKQRIERLVEAAAASPGEAAGVESASRLVVDVYQFARAGVAEVDALFQLTVPGSGAEAALARLDLARAKAIYDAQRQLIASSGSVEINNQIRDMEGRPGVQPVLTAIADQLTADPPVVTVPEPLASIFRASFQRADLLQMLVNEAVGDARALAAQRRAEADTQFRNSIVVFVLLTIGATMLALLLARSITRRLKPLGEHARRVSEGELDGEDADVGGPREIAVVARALNESVANLRRIEDQARALARGDLEAEVLAHPGAGAIGASIHTTVQHLADAWRESEELKRRLAHQANHDLLTALPNRKAALEALDGALARAHRYGETVGVLFVDLDDFKRANDAYGHHAGDRVLKLCAERLAMIVRHGDIVARLGGDEFVVIAERLESIRDAVDLAERIIAVLSEPFEIDGATTHVGASVGIGTSFDVQATSLDLLRDADNAVHRAKRMGKSRVEIFDEQARDELAADSALEHALRQALAAHELKLHYQQITDTATGRLCGFEALARWQLGGVSVPPMRFVAVAEQSDLVNDLGRWALVEATTQMQAWIEQGVCVDAYMAVNISGRHLLHVDFLDDVHHALAVSGLDPKLLTVEITETVVLDDLVAAATVLSELRSMGVRVALDDFGTGYTSIGHLWQLPIDVIKIDGSFIRHLDTPHDQVLVELMIEVAHTLGLGLVGEGVETQVQFDALRDMACDSIQGYLIARPEPPNVVRAVCSEHDVAAGD